MNIFAQAALRFRMIFFFPQMTRHTLSNLPALRVLFKKLAESVKQPVSYNRIANVVSQTGVKISVNTVINYIEYAKNAWFITLIQNIAGKIVEKETMPINKGFPYEAETLYY